MGRSSSKRLLMLAFLTMVLLVQTDGHNKACLEEERMGLLELKWFVKSNINEDADGSVLGSWVDDKGSDCCEWERVTCNSVTGRVMELSLSNIRQLDEEDEILPWSLNTSLFLPFEELMSLDLSQNWFEGCLENEGFERLSSLKMLEALDLGFNMFNKTILPSLGTLTSMRALTLRDTQVWEGLSCPFKELASLRNLKMLDLGGCANFQLGPVQVVDFGRLSSLKKLEILLLDYNGGLDNSILPYLGTLTSLKELNLSNNFGLSGSFPPTDLATLVNLEILDVSEGRWGYFYSEQPATTDFAGFNKLKVLDLSYNDLTESSLGFIWNLSSLQVLSLRDNDLSASLIAEGFCRMEKLQKLDLSSNSFDGTVPSCLRNFKFLRELDISCNQFIGNVPSSLISNLTSLESINLGNNSFTGLFSFSPFADLQNLQVVALSHSGFEVETEYSSWVPKFQLNALLLSNCSLNKLTRDVPKFLSSQTHLQQIDLSHNNLKGDPLLWLKNHTRLKYLNLKNNSFSGQFPVPSYPNYMQLSILDISKNHFSGLLPENIGEMLPNLEFLNLAKNAFQGHIPTSISDMSGLILLDLSSNNFSGEVTTKLITGLHDLRFLKLSDNRFHGSILSAAEFRRCSLYFLQLDNNQFMGSIFGGIYNCSLLSILDIGNNNFSGEIPRWISNMTSLTALIMRNNSFHGQILHEFSHVHYLDLSYNSLSGSLPPSLLNSSLEYILLQGNEFMGSIPIPKHLPNRGVLFTLDLGSNNLSGKIPKSLYKFSELNVLSLRENNFISHIPNSLCQLSNINILDLSSNSFSGPIPSCFNNMSFGRRYAQDYNNIFSIEGWGISLPTTDLIIPVDVSYYLKIEVEFITKGRDNIYKGDILNFMSGLDLSSNNLTGEIPYELGHLTFIHALNLSHNWLTGSIPKDFSKLSQLESLDLSYNNLSGQIPPQLTDLNFLAVFTVAHNNFSGRIPDMKAQFGTFDESSYQENPFLCGSMTKRECNNVSSVDDHPPAMQSDENEEKWYDIDLTIFSTSFIASYLTVLLVFVVILYINPYWRRRWFFLIEERLYSCSYFASDMIYKFFSLLC